MMKMITAIFLIFIITLSANAADTSTVIFPGIPTTFSLHEKRVVKSIDTLIAPSLARLSLTSPASGNNDQSDLAVSGYKSFGVSVGELGEVNLEQGLEVTIEGEIRPGTTLGAYLSDQGSSLEGTTREISEFDMVNVKLDNENFSVTAGDQFAERPEGGILSGQKKIVGISASVTPQSRAPGLAVSAFGAFSGGSNTVQTFRGREGVQGPYYLTGRGEANIITPVSGTVRVRVNGKDLAEGRDEDFVVDYDLGAVTFNPRVMIRGDDFIRAEYEYKAFDYRRTFTGGGAAWRSNDSVFSVRGNLWSESDDKNSPIEMQLSESEKNILKNSGSDPAYAALTARPVHPLDAAKMSVYYPLYKKAFDTASGDTILVYAPYDPLKPNDVFDFYTASFFPAKSGADGADYVIDNTVSRGQFVYVYAGKGQGDHTALAPIAAPMRETSGEFEARLKLPYLRSSLNVAGKEVDRNLFSKLDNSEGENLSSAAIFKLGAGEKRMDKRSAWADFDYRFRSRNFTSEILSANERKQGWDGGIGLSGNGADGSIVDGTIGRQYQSWEGSVGGTVVKGAAVSAGGGQAFADSLVETEKISGGAELLFMRDIMGLDFGGTLFKHHMSDIDVSYRRSAKLSAKPSDAWEGSAGYGDEWRYDTSGRGGGHISGTLEAAYIPANLRQVVNVTQYRKGDSFPGSADTGYALTWNQSAAWAPLDIWRLTGDSRWRYTKIDEQGSTSAFLMSAVSEVEPTSHGFSSRQEYRLNRELASRFEQKMFYIGKGLGTHAFDSTTGEFRPSANGDHVIQEVEIYDNTGGATVRKTTLDADWHFKPVKKIAGILGDLAWSGVLSIEEHIDAMDDRVRSYIPGYLSLFPDNDGDDKDDPYQTSRDYPSNPYYSDILYRQDVDYHVKNSIYKSRLYLMPGMRIVRGYTEKSFETALRVERKKNKLTLSAEPKYLSLSRESNDRSAPSYASGYSGVFDSRDVSVELIQSREFRNIFEFYVRERAGRIFDNGQNRVTSVPADSGIYFQLTPGVACRPLRGGLAELYYSFSYVPYAGELDYRMAGGFSNGVSHVITLHGDIRMGNHFNLSGLYRGEIARRIGEENFAPITHVFSLMIKAFL